jgi:hypothetical protein
MLVDSANVWLKTSGVPPVGVMVNTNVMLNVEQDCRGSGRSTPAPIVSLHEFEV